MFPPSHIATTSLGRHQNPAESVDVSVFVIMYAISGESSVGSCRGGDGTNVGSVGVMREAPRAKGVCTVLYEHEQSRQHMHFEGALIMNRQIHSRRNCVDPSRKESERTCIDAITITGIILSTIISSK